VADYYIDPSIVSAGGQGIGTSGDPFGKTVGVIQYALDEVGNSTVGPAANGDTFHIKSTGKVDMNNLNIDWTSYGTPTEQIKHVCFAGYTTTAWDGGRGTIDCGTASFNSSADSIDEIWCYNINFEGTNTSGAILEIDRQPCLISCQFDGKDTAVQWFNIGGRGMVIDCWCHSLAGDSAYRAAYAGFGTDIYFSHFDASDSVNANVGTMVVNAASAVGNIVQIPNNASAEGSACGYQGACYIGNRYYGQGTGIGILLNYDTTTAINNYIENCATAIDLNTKDMPPTVLNNRWYNCTTGLADTSLYRGPTLSNSNFALTSSGFVDAANGNFNLTGELLAANLGFPVQYRGLSNHLTHASIGGSLPYNAPYIPKLRSL
jgi:hypothetical protein